MLTARHRRIDFFFLQAECVALSPTIRVSTFFYFNFFEIAIGLVISWVQIGIETQCKTFFLNIEVWILRGDIDTSGSQKHDFVVT